MLITYYNTACVIAAGDCEFILPSRFLQGNPKWRSSLAGGQQQQQLSHRVHPAPLEGHDTHSRGVSLDWPGRVASNSVGAAAAAAAAAAAGGGGSKGRGEGHAAADVVATVAVRSKADVGEWYRGLWGLGIWSGGFRSP